MTINSPSQVLEQTGFPGLLRSRLTTLQVNLGYRCNQACRHCHVDAGPLRTEVMDRKTIDHVIDFLRQAQIQCLDLTGGAPELNPHFRDLVMTARGLDVEVIDRCNLTIMLEPGQETLAQFLSEHQVRVVASLPCYGEDNVDRQRGLGVFEKSIAAIKQLNALGYGQPGSGLVLDLVFNPQGPVLPPDPAELEAQYRTELGPYGIDFSRLLTITNMPINRFRHALKRDGELAGYMKTLVDNFQADNLEQVMCRSLLSVDWQGYVYDCDFNQMLSIPAGYKRQHLSELRLAETTGQPIATAEHCFGCTAGRGSSCGGALKN